MNDTSSDRTLVRGSLRLITTPFVTKLSKDDYMQISVFHCSQVGQKKDEHLSIPSNQLCRQLRESVTVEALSIRFAYGPCFGPTVCHSFLFHPFIRTLGISKAHMHIGHNLDLICMLNRNINMCPTIIGTGP